jgi:hypothetical protein
MKEVGSSEKKELDPSSEVGNLLLSLTPSPHVMLEREACSSY